ncbi:unnamed protein product [Moneuplotes crassus]|uniref:Palmitoyltransferase n=1 Tax=Euplotes crassus TaxID=5936 RepID=A0AAD1XKT4_EUPCR|nr:unnamed protein product [Moneuplotes crassus]
MEERLKHDKLLRIFLKFPAVMNIALLTGMTVAFHVFVVSNYYTQYSKRLAIVLSCMQIFIYTMCMWSLITIFCNDPGFVPKNLKDLRPELYQRVKAESNQEMGGLHQMNEMTASKRTKTADLESQDNSADLESQDLIKTDGSDESTEAQDKSKKSKKNRKRVSTKERMTRFNYCHDCDNIQPPRAQHCHLCTRCILRHDHHCPWVGNCVGYNTYKNFFLFLFYTSFGALLGAICYISGWYNGFFGRFPKDKFTIATAIPTALSTMTFFSLSMMTFFIGFCIARNLIISEMSYIKGFLSPHNYSKSTLENIKEVMGDNPLTWFVPQFRIPRNCNGIDYTANVLD